VEHGQFWDKEIKMSADNGIYILKTKNPSGDGFEYRVIHAQAIENIYWNDKLGKQMYGVLDPENTRNYYSTCKVYTDESEVRKEANRLEEDILSDDFCPILEYGVCVLDHSDVEFPVKDRIPRTDRVELNQKIRYVHLRLWRRGGVITVATVRSPKDPSVAFFGFAFCSPKDQFVKAKGREIAQRRLSEGLKHMRPVPGLGYDYLLGNSNPATLKYASYKFGKPTRPYVRSLKVLDAFLDNHVSIPNWVKKEDLEEMCEWIKKQELLEDKEKSL
jgi:hypothetical protein